jgi:WNK lysine deficient protein kinase
MALISGHDDPPMFGPHGTEVVRDPEGRYRRCEIIGNGAFKIVYRAYDQEEGIEVAWNEIRLGNCREADSNNIQKEIRLLGSLHHPRILGLFTAWIDKTRKVLVFITEFFTNGTIRSYINDVVRTPSRTVISKWCSQILDALNYMHTHDPAVIHRDLKCDNLFIDASEGVVKIGDFGLSREIANGQEAESKLGTPAYTAPEVYNGRYTTAVDIWSFGLCVLEMVTGETPYSECANIGAIYLKVSAHGLPSALSKVADPVIADFITMCLLPAEVRPSAATMLEHALIVETDQPELETDEENPPLPEFEEPQHPEFTALVERQQKQVEELKLQQRRERVLCRQRIREKMRRADA